MWRREKEGEVPHVSAYNVPHVRWAALAPVSSLNIVVVSEKRVSPIHVSYLPLRVRVTVFAQSTARVFIGLHRVYP